MTGHLVGRRAARLAVGVAIGAAALPAAVASAATVPASTAAPATPHTLFQTDTVAQALLPSGELGPATLRWNPCRTLHYAIDTAGAPAGFVAEARRAVSEMSRDTGLTWHYTGLTKIRPDLGKPAGVPSRLASQDLQLIISWNTKSIAPHATLGSEAAGTLRMNAGTVTTDVDGVQTITPTQLTEAAIVIDRSAEAALVANDGNGNGLYRLLLHQLGHAVGLDHVTDPHQVMNPAGRHDGPVTYGPGDLAGLRAVGRDAGCL